MSGAAKSSESRKIAYQGEPGAYSHLASRRYFPDHAPVACNTFEDALSAIAERKVDLGMIPIENSVAGRVADIHHLLPDSGLYVVGERFTPVHHQLLALKGAKLEGLTTVMSHPQGLGQCRKHIRALGLKPVVDADTAGAARRVAEMKDPKIGAIASELAAEIYGLDILQRNVEDAGHNTTRFVVLAADPDDAEPGSGPTVTTLVFRVRNVPAALYKALGGFATNGVNITKLESYQLEGSFSATQFYADIEGHPQDHLVRLALEELAFFTSSVKVLGVYPADPFRTQTKNS